MSLILWTTAPSIGQERTSYGWPSEITDYDAIYLRGPFPAERQQTLQTCWAAVTRTTHAFYSRRVLSECQIASSVTGEDCCNRPGSGRCLNGNPGRVNLYEALEHFGYRFPYYDFSNHNRFPAGGFSYVSLIVRQLYHNKVVLLALENLQGGGNAHIATITGAKLNLRSKKVQFEIFDPYHGWGLFDSSTFRRYNFDYFFGLQPSGVFVVTPR